MLLFRRIFYHLYCRSISTRGSASRGSGEGTKVKTTKTSGVEIPVGIVIFLVFNVKLSSVYGWK